jgi:hypothetical protein
MSGRRRPATVRVIGADVRWGTEAAMDNRHFVGTSAKYEL